MTNAKLFLCGILLLVTFFLVASFSSVLSLFCIAAILAFLLNPIANFLSHRLKLKKGLAVLAVFILVCLLCFVILSTLLPILGEQAKKMIDNTPQYGQALDGIYRQLIGQLAKRDLPEGVLEALNNIWTHIQTFFANLLFSIVTTVINWSTQLLDLVIILVVTVYLMLDTRSIIYRVASLFPPAGKQRFLLLVEEYNRLVWQYIKSKALIAAGMAVATFIVLSIVGVDAALLLACLAFILDFIPYFGSIFGGAIASLVALITGGWVKALITLACILVIQQIEGNIVSPKVQGDLVGLHPIAVIFSLLACNSLWGVMGMFIAGPVASLVKIILRDRSR